MSKTALENIGKQGKYFLSLTLKLFMNPLGNRIPMNASNQATLYEIEFTASEMCFTLHTTYTFSLHYEVNLLKD